MAHEAQATLHAALRILSSTAERRLPSWHDQMQAREYSQDFETPIAAGLVYDLLTELASQPTLDGRQRIM